MPCQEAVRMLDDFGAAALLRRRQHMQGKIFHASREEMSVGFRDFDDVCGMRRRSGSSKASRWRTSDTRRRAPRRRSPPRQPHFIPPARRQPRWQRPRDVSFEYRRRRQDTAILLFSFLISQASLAIRSLPSADFRRRRPACCLSRHLSSFSFTPRLSSQHAGLMMNDCFRGRLLRD